MAQTESDRTKTTSTRKRPANKAAGHPQDGEQTEQAANAYEPPKDLHALREARLKSMTTPPVARNKMKIEYVQQRPTRARSVSAVDTRSTKHTSSIFGRGPLSEAVKMPVVRVRERTKKDVKSDDEAQYVYKQKSGVDRRDFQKEHDKAAREERRKNKTADQNTKVARDVKPETKQKRAETTSRPKASSPSSRPASQRETTKETAGRNTAPSVISNARSTATTTKKSSVLGSWFTAPQIPEKIVSCLTCGSDDIPVSKSAKLPCTHRMCHACLKRIFKMSVKDPAHMPPTCCTEEHIDLKHVDKLFSQDFKKLWNHKFKEYTAKNRIYCPKRDCREWIQAKHMHRDQGRKVGKCPKCKTLVCATCNEKAHKSKDCPKDPATIELTKVAKEKGWKKCYNCSRMVELKEGCNHMTCWCRAEFCMVCGLKWKSCDCPWFNYDAVNDLRGNPVRYQQELDRRREQEARDEEFARQLAGMGRRGQVPLPDLHQVRDNAAEPDLNPNFVQQAREALTANYQNAEAAARGLLAGWFARGEQDVPHEEPQLQAQALPRPQRAANVQYQNTLPLPLGRRRTYRVRNSGRDPQEDAAGVRRVPGVRYV